MKTDWSDEADPRLIVLEKRVKLWKILLQIFFVTLIFLSGYSIFTNGASLFSKVSRSLIAHHVGQSIVSLIASIGLDCVAFVTGIVVPFSVLATFFAYKRSTTISKRDLDELTEHKGIQDKQITDVADRLSNRIGIKRPHLLKYYNTRPDIRSSFIGNDSFVIISTGFLGMFGDQPKELEAALAHELFHIKNKDREKVKMNYLSKTVGNVFRSILLVVIPTLAAFLVFALLGKENNLLTEMIPELTSPLIDVIAGAVAGLGLGLIVLMVLPLVLSIIAVGLFVIPAFLLGKMQSEKDRLADLRTIQLLRDDKALHSLLNKISLTFKAPRLVESWEKSERKIVSIIKKFPERKRDYFFKLPKVVVTAIYNFVMIKSADLENRLDFINIEPYEWCDTHRLNKENILRGVLDFFVFDLVRDAVSKSCLSLGIILSPLFFIAGSILVTRNIVHLVLYTIVFIIAFTKLIKHLASILEVL